ncbi:hypothetical protein Ciccas_006677 [Cichlidogyrus casuarinus]|uniref:Uncharacterized protein n=1 Tax=Cichlidogyrus casuarinus TaxID=1844966 RepID=A0ABD2Q527_9PLAT
MITVPDGLTSFFLLCAKMKVPLALRDAFFNGSGGGGSVGQTLVPPKSPNKMTGSFTHKLLNSFTSLLDDIFAGEEQQSLYSEQSHVVEQTSDIPSPFHVYKLVHPILGVGSQS